MWLSEHRTRVDRVRARWTRRGRFSGFYVARCVCGWRGRGVNTFGDAAVDRHRHLASMLDLAHPADM